MDEGAWRKLTPSSKLKYLGTEKNIRKTHSKITKTMSMTELKALKKHEHRDLMKNEMYDMVPQLTETAVHTACHYISNAVSNLQEDLHRERKRGTKPSNDGKGDPAVDWILPKICLNLSRKCQFRTMFWMIHSMVTSYMMLCLAQTIASQLKKK